MHGKEKLLNRQSCSEETISTQQAAQNAKVRYGGGYSPCCTITVLGIVGGNSKGGNEGFIGHSQRPESPRAGLPEIDGKCIALPKDEDSVGCLQHRSDRVGLPCLLLLPRRAGLQDSRRVRSFTQMAHKKTKAALLFSARKESLSIDETAAQKLGSSHHCLTEGDSADWPAYCCILAPQAGWGLARCVGLSRFHLGGSAEKG